MSGTSLIVYCVEVIVYCQDSYFSILFSKAHCVFRFFPVEPDLIQCHPVIWKVLEKSAIRSSL